jgi:hypothetical protein
LIVSAERKPNFKSLLEKLVRLGYNQITAHRISPPCAKESPMLKPLHAACLLFLSLTALSAAARADWPLADTLQGAGITFADKPVTLPVTPQFQTALTSIATDLGKSCTSMAAYGWRLSQTEQERVNGIFSGTVAALQAQGFAMTPHTPANASREVTVFSAMRAKTELLLLWSAGESGLALLTCATPAESATATMPEATATTDETVVAPPVKAKKIIRKKTVKRPMAAAAPLADTAASVASPLPEAIVPPGAAADPQAAATPHSLSQQRVSPTVKAMLDELPTVAPTAPPTAAPAAAPAPVAPLPPLSVVP